MVYPDSQVLGVTGFRDRTFLQHLFRNSQFLAIYLTAEYEEFSFTRV